MIPAGRSEVNGGCVSERARNGGQVELEVASQFDPRASAADCHLTATDSISCWACIGGETARKT
jgi:hypothetical protein